MCLLNWQVLLDKLALDKEKHTLLQENQQLRAILKQYLDGKDPSLSTGHTIPESAQCLPCFLKFVTTVCSYILRKTVILIFYVYTLCSFFKNSFNAMVKNITFFIILYIPTFILTTVIIRSTHYLFSEWPKA